MRAQGQTYPDAGKVPSPQIDSVLACRLHSSPLSLVRSVSKASRGLSGSPRLLHTFIQVLNTEPRTMHPILRDSLLPCSRSVCVLTMQMRVVYEVCSYIILLRRHLLAYCTLFPVVKGCGAEWTTAGWDRRRPPHWGKQTKLDGSGKRAPRSQQSLQSHQYH